jgi:hypothetical protein
MHSSQAKHLAPLLEQGSLRLAGVVVAPPSAAGIVLIGEPHQPSRHLVALSTMEAALAAEDVMDLRLQMQQRGREDGNATGC